MQKYQDTIIDARGRPVSGATVSVTTSAAAAATIYSDDGVTAISSLTTDATGSFAFYAADGRYNIAISKTGFATRTITDVLLEDPEDKASDELLAWAYIQAFRIVSATRNSDGAITTATIEWPDGVDGVYTADTLSTEFPGATDAWHATYVGDVTKTVTQAAVTRNTDGAVTAQPAITIT